MKLQDSRGTYKLILFAFAITVYALFAYAFGNESICIFKVYSGVPCPGCGMTRSFIALTQGHVQQAFFWHPLWPLVIIGPLIYGLLDKKSKNTKAKNAFIWFIFAIFVSTYVYRMYLYFPEQAPMDFNNHSYFYQIYEHLFNR